MQLDPVASLPNDAIEEGSRIENGAVLHEAIASLDLDRGCFKLEPVDFHKIVRAEIESVDTGARLDHQRGRIDVAWCLEIKLPSAVEPFGCGV